MIEVSSNDWDACRCYGCDKDLTDTEEYVEYWTRIRKEYFKLCTECDKKMDGFCLGGIRKAVSISKKRNNIILHPFRWKLIHGR